MLFYTNHGSSMAPYIVKLSFICRTECKPNDQVREKEMNSFTELFRFAHLPSMLINVFISMITGPKGDIGLQGETREGPMGNKGYAGKIIK